MLTALPWCTIVKSCNVEVIGENRPRVMDTLEAMKNRLESDGFRCKGTEESGDHQRFLGLIFDRLRGRFSLSHQRLWKLRLSLLDAAAQEVLLLRRNAPVDCVVPLGGLALSLSAFHCLSWLPPLKSSGRRQSVVKLELCQHRATRGPCPRGVALHDTRRSFDEVVCSTGASTSEGEASLGRYGLGCSAA